jgi:PPP family 3-phenylpropionic acid transporter
MPLPASLGLRLSALHAATFTGIGVYLSFFPVWLQSRAMSATTIGLVIAVPILVRIVAAAPLLTLADRRLGPRRLLIGCHGVQIALYPVLFFVENELAITAMVALLAVAQAAVIPGNDLVTTNAIRDGAHLNYGRVRVWGSVAFLSASIAAGYLVDALGPQIILWALALTPLIALVTTMLALPPGAAPVRALGAPEAAPATVSLPRVLWLVMAGVAATQASHGAIYAFGSIHWRALGFSDTAIGYLWAIGVVAEIGIFYFLGQAVGRKRAALGLIMLGGAAAAVRFATLALDPSLAVTFGLQALHGLTFGATHLGGMAALAAFAPAAARGRAQGLFASASALGMAAATIVSGPVYRAEGSLVFAAMAPLGLIGLLFAVWAARMTAAEGREAEAARPRATGEDA